MGVEAVVAIVLTGMFVVLPVVFIMTNHQRKMAELLHKQQGPREGQNELLQRLDAIQQELHELRDRQNELILERHDSGPPPVPKVEDRIGQG